MQRLPATRDSALSDLNRAITALETHFQAPEDLANLARLRAMAARLDPTPGLAAFEPARLHHLLTLAGPDMRAALIAQLGQDLTACAQRLDGGQTRLDWAELRDASHVLISLAGSVGALSLQAMAEDLNAFAQDQRAEDIAALMPRLTAELRALRQIVQDAGPPPFSDKANDP